MNTFMKVSMATLFAVTVVLSTGGPAFASPPSNDTESGAVRVDSVPFTHAVDTTDATPGGPRFCSSHASVFYTFTPSANVRVQVDTLGSEYDTTLAIYERDDAGNVVEVGCSDDRIGDASGLRLRALAGTAYVFMVGRCCGNPPRGEPGRPGGPLVLTVSAVSSAPLDVTISVGGGTVDPSTGVATISGTITCTRRAGVYVEGTLRQVRQGIFVARGYVSAYEACTPGAPVPWSTEVDTETSVIFGAGPATFKRYYLSAYAGWHQWFQMDEIEVSSLQLV
jgi:hypothetical protein